MNIYEAIHSGKPFNNPSMIGAWMLVNGFLVHRDNIADFSDIEWIEENCLPFLWTNGDRQALVWFDVADLMRNDWQTVTL